MALYDPIYGYSGMPTMQFPVNMPSPAVQPTAQNQPYQQPPFVKVITVSGEDAAKSMKLAPGSTLLATDENEAVIWFIKSNDVGPNTVSRIPFDPSIFSGSGNVSPVDLSSIESRLSSIEERMSRYESVDESNKRNLGNSGNNGRR